MSCGRKKNVKVSVERSKLSELEVEKLGRDCDETNVEGWTLPLVDCPHSG